MKHFGPELFKLKDRKDRLFALGPTHEEVVTGLARSELRSYRQLPQCLYQILTKFRDEIRPRFGVMRAREFIMKDAYSFHDSQESLEETYQKMAGAYSRILSRCGLENVMVEADAGKIGGDVNHEFVVLAEEGESEIVSCSCGYAAALERAETLGTVPAAMEEALESPRKVDTPGRKTVDEVTSFLEVDASQLVKTLLFRSQDEVVAVLIPGNRTLNEARLMRVLGDPYVEPLDEEGIKKLTGAEVGFAGPVGLPAGTRIIADPLLEEYDGMIVGANATDTHLRGVRMGRDFEATELQRVCVAEAGDRCVRCKNPNLAVRRGVELGHIFKLGTKYSESMNATYLDREGKERHFIMGCYGFGVSRTVAAAIEANYDERGIRWPRAIAPFHAIVLPVNMSDDKTLAVGEALYEELRAGGWDVLLDDRDLRAGFKFKDSELVGVPLRITVGERNLKDGKVEIYQRQHDRTELVDRSAVAAAIEEFYGDVK